MKSRLFTLCVALAALTIITPAASANVLGNPGFEIPAITPPDVEAPGAGDDWDSFNSVFTVTSAVVPPNSGDQSLKMFGTVAGAFQTFPASEGEIWNGGSWIRNDSVVNGGNDQLANGQVAAVNIEWLDVNEDQISFISNGTFTPFPCDGCAAPLDEWTLKTVTGEAPADTAFARLTLITGDFQAGGPGGAAYYDDAFFEVIPEPGSVSLLGMALLGLLGMRRRR